MTWTDEPLECLDRGGPSRCVGPVGLWSVGDSLKVWPRCDAHQADREIAQEEINRKYAPFSDCPPEGFDPLAAGERWDDDY